jgi:hypothetical protein
MVVPVYLAEMSPPHYRGTIVTLNTLTCTGGQFVAGLVGGGFANVADGWRYMLGALSRPGCVLGEGEGGRGAGKDWLFALWCSGADAAPWVGD